MKDHTCIKCGHTGPAETDFPQSSPGVYRRTCKPCHSKKVREWQIANDTPGCRKNKNAMTESWRQRKRDEGKGNEVWRKHSLKSKYGLTLDQYEAMLASQNGVCAICKQADPEGKALAVDHNHMTGENRGLLCGLCNKAIGLLKDSTELLHSAIDYLKSYQLPKAA